MRSPSNNINTLRPGQARVMERLTPDNSKAAVASLLNCELDYCRALLDPEGSRGAKVPDMLNLATATYQTIITVPVFGNTAVGTAPADMGRFFYAIQPVMSNITSFDSLNQTPTVAFAPPATTWMPTGLTSINSVNDPNVASLIPTRNSTPPKTGLMLRARPVSMSAWFQYEGDLINNGGEVAAALVTGDTWADNVTLPQPAGSLVQWENLANYPDAFQGALCNGTYTWWRPEGPSDTSFLPVDSSARQLSMYQMDYPAIYIAGQATHPGNALSNTPVGRIRVCINYEYVTDSRVIPTTPSPVSPLGMMLAAKITSGLPTSMANESHDGFISDVLKYAVAGLAGFFLGGGPLGAAAAVLGVMGLRTFGK